MRHELANRNFTFAVLRKLGNVTRYGIIELDLPKLHHAHQAAGGRNHLGQRRDVEHCVDRHRLFRGFKRAVAKRLAINHLPLVADHDDCARNVSTGNGVLDDSINRLKAVGVSRQIHRQSVVRRSASWGWYLDLSRCEARQQNDENRFNP